MDVSFFPILLTLIRLISLGSLGKFLAGSFTSCGKVTQWSLEAIPPCLSICTFKQGEMRHISCCSIIVNPDSSVGSFWGSILFSGEINLIRVRKIGKNESSRYKRFVVLKFKNAVLFLKQNIPAYSDIIISQESLNSLPEDGELHNILTVYVHSNRVRCDI
jgi:hypothetical protein